MESVQRSQWILKSCSDWNMISPLFPVSVHLVRAYTVWHAISFDISPTWEFASHSLLSDRLFDGDIFTCCGLRWRWYVYKEEKTQMLNEGGKILLYTNISRFCKWIRVCKARPPARTAQQKKFWEALMSCYSCVSDRNTKLAQVSMEMSSLRRTVCPDVPACASMGMSKSRDAAFMSLSSITFTAVGFWLCPMFYLSSQSRFGNKCKEPGFKCQLMPPNLM